MIIEGIEDHLGTFSDRHWAELDGRLSMVSNASRAVMINPKKARLGKMRKTILNAGRLIHDGIGGGSRVRGFRAAMITLTYARVDAWDANHIRSFLTHVRNFLARRGFKFRYVWTAELQERGAVHYHVVVWLPRNIRLPKPDRQGWWTFGHSNCKFATKPVGYLVKYASKANETNGKNFPKGCRIYGFGGLETIQKQELRWWRSPVFVRNEIPMLGSDIRKAKGGYFCKNTGQFVESRWFFIGFVNRIPIFVFIPLDDPDQTL